MSGLPADIWHLVFDRVGHAAAAATCFYVSKHLREAYESWIRLLPRGDRRRSQLPGARCSCMRGAPGDAEVEPWGHTFCCARASRVAPLDVGRAVRYGQNEIALVHSVLQRVGSWRGTPPGLIYNACKYGNLEFLQMLHAIDVPAFTARSARIAAKHGHLDIFRFFYTNPSKCESVSVAFLVDNGRPEFVRFWISELGLPFGGCELHIAAAAGNVEMLEVLRDELGCQWDGSERAAAAGKEEVIKALDRLGCPP